ncbi:stage II sporulation protein D [Desulforamulus hydrothermalis]|uniref:SpoIID/LytB domain protein n=1 Tax=Desulforamulus hydrothermalis Lam5 = DSM 18033 TaxID=1121428 RepID=K8EA29_9FIRM|nr:stage II sporulation protein D [Desulforamulus hydrothermalis]CCO08438.1 SpoIID/LytB domain protein [Desulforamulus hydrothermalis Lam5 = DSM 18033]SHH15432.1 stage II sporulation protein D [Desulforamulus hydrothermalis Lam5 = DSM 18033]
MRKLLLALLALALLAYLWPPRQPGSQIESRGTQVRLYNHATGAIQTMPLEEYLVGVVAAEMPAAFPLEALKAQAVAARTYIMLRLSPGGVQNSRHPGADVSSDPKEGQAWLDREAMQKRWGKVKFLEYYYKIRWAVASTEGQVIIYRSRLIFPAFHAACGGHTENAEEVWVAAAPYLKGVPCAYCRDYPVVSQAAFTLAELDQKLNTNLSVLPAATLPGQAMAVTAQTSTGRPKEIRLGSKTYPATLLREMLQLRSTNLTWQAAGDKITFTTRGYGHGVGLCQNGAKGMARQGKSYQEILKHYYSGVEITTLK